MNLVKIETSTEFLEHVGESVNSMISGVFDIGDSNSSAHKQFLHLNLPGKYDMVSGAIL
ncbi:hypothetical protein NHE_0125 [Neorickettsia helminthoeca str. Oregon]|uniref:Uncharacterized protein n=2 Tax=Neorickettsia helminthoeca TaxID=33994 RepID=X5HL65_9RICK|nr:hypothetical protein NHE_0125 [Neorickettsia helminthoeca str. Oregon]